MRLELTWPHKDEFLLTTSDEKGKPVWVDHGHPAASEVRVSEFTATLGDADDDDPHGDNLLFTGDALDVLRILTEVPEFADHYRGKVKLAYLDVPFNTQQAFEHYDDWMEHSTWLSFMRDRMLLVKELLAPDGSVWVHLDDAEVHRMRLVMDEVFGMGRFVATVVWQKRTSRDNRAAFAAAHDRILVYAPAGATGWKHHRNRLEDTGAFSNPDNDPRGAWRSVPMTAQAGRATKSQFYTITTPTGVQHDPPEGRAWTYTRERFEALVEEGRVYWPREGDGKPRLKRFPDEVVGLVPFDLWLADEVGENATAKREIQSLFGKNSSFDTPKPEALVERILHVGTNPGDIVVDVFAGSGTTAAVAHKMGRRWVTAEISPRTVKEFTRPRLEKVVAGEDPGGVTSQHGWLGGGAFRSLEVGPSMYDRAEDGTVLLSLEATNGRFARAVAGQLGFSFSDTGPLCGRKGGTRLAVIDGMAGPEEVAELVGHLEEGERLTLVAKAVLPGAETGLRKAAPGSRIRKAPRDVLAAGRKRRGRR